MSTVLRKVMVTDRLPGAEKYYLTDIGDLYWDSRNWFDNRGRISITPEWYLNEIELPSEEEICNEGFNNSTCATAFAQGANYILNKIKND